MADKKKIKSEASSSSNNVNNGRGESVIIDVGYRRSSCGYCKFGSNTIVGTVEGGRASTKIKTDLKKPIINLACHPRLAVLYVGYADGLIRAYNIHTYVVLYTLQLDNIIKLLGAGAFAFHQLSNGFLLATDVVHFLLGMCQLRDL